MISSRSTRRTVHDRLATLASKLRIPTLEQLGFARTNLDDLPLPAGEAGAETNVQRLQVAHRRLRAGTQLPGSARAFVSVSAPALRHDVYPATRALRIPSQAFSDGAQVWLSELIWRDFYQMILWHHPHVADHAYRPEYDRILWATGDKADRHFAAWCEGNTGYPLIDAAMAQINLSGYMHNRLRMVTASFLVKDLGIDWRRGERYFARQLNDYDLAANSGGWQWAASTGCDAQPYFSIFNPVTQSEKFDPDGRFHSPVSAATREFTAKEIHAPWLVSAKRQKEAGCIIGRDYPKPIVDHAAARQRPWSVSA